MMSKLRKTILAFLGALLLGVLLPTAVSANSAEPPCFTVVVFAPPEGLTLSLKLPEGEEREPAVLNPFSKAWETYYRFYSGLGLSEEEALSGKAELLVEYGEESFTCPLPVEKMDRYNTLLTLDWRNRALTVGVPGLRDVLLVGFRVGLTLLIEALVFFLFGYRRLRSWLVFLSVNLATQAMLNLFLIHVSSITGGTSGAIYLYLPCEFFVFLIETLAFPILVREHRKRRAVVYALTANAASLVLGGLVITYLPF